MICGGGALCAPFAGSRLPKGVGLGAGLSFHPNRPAADRPASKSKPAFAFLGAFCGSIA